MEFDPHNHIIQLCLQGMELEAKGEADEALTIFRQAWNEATNDFEKFMAAHYLARLQKTTADRLKWLEIALHLALKLKSETVNGVFPTLYLNLARCYEELGKTEKAKENYELAASVQSNLPDKGPFYHGTRADLQPGDLLTAGFRSNYNSEVIMNHIYFTAMINGAGLAAALAKGEGRERVYIVEPAGSFENDPNVTDKKFPGNPTRSYRSTGPLKVIGEIMDWVKLTPEQLKTWQQKLANIKKAEIIN